MTATYFRKSPFLREFTCIGRHEQSSNRQAVPDVSCCWTDFQTEGSSD